MNDAISSGQRERRSKVVDMHTIHIDLFSGPQDTNQDMLSFIHSNERYASEPNIHVNA